MANDQPLDENDELLLEQAGERLVQLMIKAGSGSEAGQRLAVCGFRTYFHHVAREHDHEKR